MKRLFATTWAMALIISAATILHAQTATPGTSDTRRATRITVGGDSVVRAQPDTAILTISVVTQARRAIDAQQENAT
ncbi:MAG TPA: SIMPL domain-containing protein, partial [Pyrinomonadaceae bacterium]|nr:SIMPL domain-containing protein [Pyrinomonadaceae bacterium]